MENFGIKNREELESVITDRSFEDYQNLFKVNFAKMKGKTILDIGSGRGDFFDKATKLGVNVNSISPEFKKDKKFRYKKNTHEHGDVAARAQEMPFADNSFDYEFALYSVPFWLPYHFFSNKAEEILFTKEFTKCIDEIIRTLKPNSKGYIYPLSYPIFRSRDSTDIIREILKTRSNKVIYTIEEGKLILTKK